MNAQLEGIKAIIFDLGNVVIDLHYERAANKLAELSGLSLPELNQLLVSSDVLKVFEVGGISEDAFRRQVCKLLKINLIDEEFDSIWNSLLGEISTTRIEKMIELKRKYQTLVLSNTNSIHLRSFDHSLSTNHGYDGVHQLVRKAYYSHIIGRRKPNADIYEFVLNEQELLPNETLFIDDREDNIQAASQLGIRTFLNRNIDDWVQILD